MKIFIRKGEHKCNRFLPIIKYNQVKGTVCFEGDFEYNIEKQKDTNKLIGISDSYHHHINSIRIGWRWSIVGNCIEIMTILYKDGTRTIEHLCFLNQKRLNSFSIVVKRKSYKITFNEYTISIDRSSNWFLPRYILLPYFGGTTKSPKSFKFVFNIK